MEQPFLDRKISLVNLFEITSAIENTGIVHLSDALTEEATATLLKKAVTLEYTPLPTSNSYGVEQHMHRTDAGEIPVFQELAHELGSWLSYRFSLVAGWEHMRPVFDDMAIQRYQTCPIGISPHRDSKSLKLVIAIVVLSGSAKYSTCRERSVETARVTVETKPGDLVLMRAPGFAGEGDEERPFHTVYNIQGPRHVAALRISREEK